MSAASGAFGARAGFNQSGGYLMIVSSINLQLNSLTPGSGSGGATNPPTFAAVPVGGDGVLGRDALTSLFGTGRVVKDMGKSAVSAGRVFRKIQAVNRVDQATPAARTNGVTGGAESTSPAAAGYATYYIETGFENNNGATALPMVARFL